MRVITLVKLPLKGATHLKLPQKCTYYLVCFHETDVSANESSRFPTRRHRCDITELIEREKSYKRGRPHW